MLSDNNICLTWSQLENIQTPPEKTTDFVYLRLIGDRSIEEKNFGTIQKDRIAEMEKWAKIVQGKKKKNNKKMAEMVKFVIVAANNHYAGFGPGTANNFRKMLGLSEVV